MKVSKKNYLWNKLQFTKSKNTMIVSIERKLIYIYFFPIFFCLFVNYCRVSQLLSWSVRIEKVKMYYYVVYSLQWHWNQRNIPTANRIFNFRPKQHSVIVYALVLENIALPIFYQSLYIMYRRHAKHHRSVSDEQFAFPVSVIWL